MGNCNWQVGDWAGLARAVGTEGWGSGWRGHGLKSLEREIVGWTARPGLDTGRGSHGAQTTSRASAGDEVGLCIIIISNNLIRAEFTECLLSLKDLQCTRLVLTRRHLSTEANPYMYILPGHRFEGLLIQNLSFRFVN